MKRLALLALAACASTPHRASAPSAPAVPSVASAPAAAPRSAPLAAFSTPRTTLAPPPTAPAPLAGRWRTTDGRTIEHWIAADTRLWGVSLSADSFEIMLAERLGPRWAYYAMPNGGDPRPFPEVARASDSILFNRGGGDFPVQIEYRLRDDGHTLIATLSGNGQSLELVHAPDDEPPPRELIPLDRALSAALLDPDAALATVSAAHRGRPAVERALRELGAVTLSPFTAGLGPDGQSAYTLGDYEIADTHVRGIYVAIWVRRDGGAFRLRHLNLGPGT